ncbi:general secretion pathway protein GspK [Planctomycetota bacterium]
MNPTSPSRSTPRQAQGTVLIVTIWVVLVLAGLAMVFARSTRVTSIVAANHIAALQAECILEGAQAYIQTQLMSEEDSTEPPSYETLPVGEGYFWALRTNPASDQELDYGLTDEAAKINLNSASLEMLLKLPDMTAELAASIIDWRDENTELTASGAESEYYLLLPEPYQCKDAPLETVEELLLIKGGSADLLYGADTNRNGIIDDYEDSAGSLGRGFYDYVTVYSVEANTDSQGETRINISQEGGNQELTTLLEETFPDKWTFILQSVSQGNFPNVLAFYQAAKNGGMTEEEFVKIVDRLTTSDDEELQGLVNVNTAPREVLLCLPEMEESDVDALLSKRGDGTDESLQSIAWVLEALDLDKAVAIGGHITTRSMQYSADMVAISGNGRAFKRAKAVFDVQDETPRLRYFRSLTHLGWPLDSEIRETLRAGEDLDAL